RRPAQRTHLSAAATGRSKTAQPASPASSSPALLLLSLSAHRGCVAALPPPALQAARPLGAADSAVCRGSDPGWSPRPPPAPPFLRRAGPRIPTPARTSPDP